MTLFELRLPGADGFARRAAAFSCPSTRPSTGFAFEDRHARFGAARTVAGLDLALVLRQGRGVLSPGRCS